LNTGLFTGLLDAISGRIYIKLTFVLYLFRGCLLGGQPVARGNGRTLATGPPSPNLVGFGDGDAIIPNFGHTACKKSRQPLGWRLFLFPENYLLPFLVFTILSTMPYFLASSASMKKSRSVSFSIFSSGCSVCRASILLSLALTLRI